MSASHNSVLGAVHIEAAHAAQALQSVQGIERLGAKCTKEAVVAGHRKNEGRIDRIRIHAKLTVVAHGNKRSVRHDAR